MRMWGKNLSKYTMYIHQQSTAFSCTACTKASKGKLQSACELCGMLIFLLALHHALLLQLMPPLRHEQAQSLGQILVGWDSCSGRFEQNHKGGHKAPKPNRAKKTPANPRGSVAAPGHPSRGEGSLLQQHSPSSPLPSGPTAAAPGSLAVRCLRCSTERPRRAAGHGSARPPGATGAAREAHRARSRCPRHRERGSHRSEGRGRPRHPRAAPGPPEVSHMLSSVRCLSISKLAV